MYRNAMHVKKKEAVARFICLKRQEGMASQKET